MLDKIVKISLLFRGLALASLGAFCILSNFVNNSQIESPINSVFLVILGIISLVIGLALYRD